VKPQLEASNAMKKVVFGSSRLPTLSMAEVRAVYAFNKGSIHLKQTTSQSQPSSQQSTTATATTVAGSRNSGSGVMSAELMKELSTMYSRTMVLLDKKAEQLTEQLNTESLQSYSAAATASSGSDTVSAGPSSYPYNCGYSYESREDSSSTTSVVALRSVQLMKGDWLAAWAQMERGCGSGGSGSSGVNWIHRCQSAMQAYREAAGATPQAGADSSSIMHSTGTTTMMTSAELRLRASAYGKLAQLNDQLLRTVEQPTSISTSTIDSQSQSQSLSLVGSAEHLAAEAVAAFVNGIRLGDSYCRDRLLRLTEIVGAYPCTAPLLLTRLASIPAWTFLRFAAQLMGCLDLPAGPAAAAILERVAKVREKITTTLISILLGPVSFLVAISFYLAYDGHIVHIFL
jgi:hypothetical protein